MTAILEYKLGSPQLVRKTCLEGHRFTPQELLPLGMLDIVTDGGTEGVLREARKLAAQKAGLAKTGVFGLMKRGLHRDVIAACQTDERQIMPEHAAAHARYQLSKL